ncbi:PadR family transcriptional regulator [Streptomyces albofaciens JCM 4342]|uniref:PadR family transcriptional regulator n=1 Tax=Streptomyces albofaciens TaxID=66866 RepID=UPI001238F893|nr:PadR family transcriptional regulator [Streptomyces albofaciens]KAA6214030.1 PadR family transcriptional regulator [Streptomyces albofaciens JCM 4342]
MPPVFAHGRLRLYLLKLLDEAPRHGYEIIRLLEERFQGLYAPSAGTVYPRLAKLEAEGLVTHTTEGGRKVYSITAAGRAELADRGGELADLEMEIRESVAALASDIREDVSGSARDVRRELREAAAQAREGRRGGRHGGEEHGFPDASDFFDGRYGDREAWRQAKEEFRRAKEEWKEQARRAKEESRRAKQDAQRARKQAREARSFVRDEVQEAIKRVQEQAQEHVRTGDWAGALREALSEVSREMGRFTVGPEGAAGADRPGGGAGPAPEDGGPVGPTKEDAAARPGGDGSGAARPEAAGWTPAEPAWASEPGSGDPARDFDRLLDRFRDDLRDAARDHGVTAEQLKDVRSRLSATAAHVGALLRDPEAYAAGQRPPR